MGPAIDKRLPDARLSLCFERTSLPPKQQLSNFPEEDEQNVKYFRGIHPGDGQASSSESSLTTLQEVEN